MRVNLLPPLYATNNLHVDIEKRWKHLVVEVVDSLLWISPQLDTISFNEARVLKTLKFIHEDASNEDEKSCCASLPWKCWRHKLKQVKMQNFSCMEQQELRDYFFTNAHISEIIDVPSE
uniref:FBD domain-containing protein n=1 Tax=Nicotiana tabacum TaxID=4097 RepID=A0A1S4DK49_TOBAC|nr:PREDICTED: uncharacterized protein LOC107830659 [Nicotiana tabacum]